MSEVGHVLHEQRRGELPGEQRSEFDHTLYHFYIRRRGIPVGGSACQV